jgi:hypothetical protein
MTDEEEITGIRELPLQFKGFATKVILDHRQLRKEHDEMSETVKSIHIDNIKNEAERKQLKWLIVLVPTAATFLHWLATHFIR